jgi:hypothetical protein
MAVNEALGFLSGVKIVGTDYRLAPYEMAVRADNISAYSGKCRSPRPGGSITLSVTDRGQEQSGDLEMINPHTYGRRHKSGVRHMKRYENQGIYSLGDKPIGRPKVG